MNHSPSPTKTNFSTTDPNAIDFPDAIRAILNGKKVTKLEWGNPGVYGFLNGEWLSLHKEDGTNYQWLVSDGDMIGIDWVVVEDADIVNK